MNHYQQFRSIAHSQSIISSLYKVQGMLGWHRYSTSTYSRDIVNSGVWSNIKQTRKSIVQKTYFNVQGPFWHPSCPTSKHSTWVTYN